MTTPSERTLTLTQIKRNSVSVPDIRVSITPPVGPDLEVPLGLKPIVVGTSPQCDLFVRGDPGMSRRHCELSITECGTILKDLNSKNGTLIGNVRIVEAMLDIDTVVTVGSSRLVARVAGSPSPVPLLPDARFGGAIGQSLVMRALFHKLSHAAGSAAPILLIGESGTGKRTLAEAVHQASPRSTEPFVIFECGAIAPGMMAEELLRRTAEAPTGLAAGRPGLLEQANRGTLFIDEPGDIPPEQQYMVSYALGSSGFDVRIIAGTRHDLRADIAAGAFRADFYHRLAGMEVVVPPVCERKGDIIMLVDHFLKEMDPPRNPLSRGTMELLEAHSWPGNVSELRDMVEQLAVSAHVGRRALEALLESGAGGDEMLKLLYRKTLKHARDVVVEQFEKNYLKAKLDEHGGNITRTAEAIGVERPYLHRLLRKRGLGNSDR